MNNTVVNVTFISATHNLVQIDGSSGGNTFYWDNFTQTCNLYADDMNGSNIWNGSADGVPEGNIWYNVMTGEVFIPGGVPSVTGLKVGTVAYADANSNGRTAGVSDFVPLTTGAINGSAEEECGWCHCGAINTPGYVCTLQNSQFKNGSDCIDVNATGDTIQCNGFSITGNNATGTYGIYSSQNQTTINNCNISNFDSAVGFVGANSSSVTNSNLSTTSTATASPPYAAAVYVTNARNDAVRGNKISSPADSVYLFASSSSIVAGNTMASGPTASAYAACLNASTDNTVANNAISINSTNGAGISTWAVSSRCNLTNNTIQAYGASHGIYIDPVVPYSSNTTIDCMGASITGSNASSTYGVYSNQFNTTVKNCIISNFSIGIYFNGIRATYGTISNTSVSTSQVYAGLTTPNGLGMLFYNGADYNTVINSSANASAGGAGGYGILIGTSTNNVVANSAFTANAGHAMYLYSGANSNTIANCTGAANSGAGIVLYLSDGGNTIANSTGTSNSGPGIDVNYYSFNNTVSDSIGASNSSYGISFYNNADGNSILGSNGTSNSGYGIYVYSSLEQHNAQFHRRLQHKQRHLPHIKFRQLHRSFKWGNRQLRQRLLYLQPIKQQHHHQFNGRLPKLWLRSHAHRIKFKQQPRQLHGHPSHGNGAAIVYEWILQQRLRLPDKRQQPVWRTPDL